MICLSFGSSHKVDYTLPNMAEHTLAFWSILFFLAIFNLTLLASNLARCYIRIFQRRVDDPKAHSELRKSIRARFSTLFLGNFPTRPKPRSYFPKHLAAKIMLVLSPDLEYNGRQSIKPRNLLALGGIDSIRKTVSTTEKRSSSNVKPCHRVFFSLEAEGQTRGSMEIPNT